MEGPSTLSGKAAAWVCAGWEVCFVHLDLMGSRGWDFPIPCLYPCLPLSLREVCTPSAPGPSEDIGSETWPGGRAAFPTMPSPESSEAQGAEEPLPGCASCSLGSGWTPPPASSWPGKPPAGRSGMLWCPAGEQGEGISPPCPRGGEARAPQFLCSLLHVMTWV